MPRPRQLAAHAISVGILTAVMLLVPWTGGMLAADNAPAARATYLKYCSACHGETGKGDGVVSGFLRPQPTDLTQLSKQAGGTFPFVPVMQSIDGSKTVRAHGNSDMPVWGESFRSQSASDMQGQMRTRGLLMLITEYFESIQAK